MGRLGGRAPIAVLALVAFAAYLIGGTFGKALTIVLIGSWVVAIGMVVYMILFRGMSFKYSMGQEDSNIESDGTAEIGTSVEEPRLPLEDGSDRTR